MTRFVSNNTPQFLLSNLYSHIHISLFKVGIIGVFGSIILNQQAIAETKQTNSSYITASQCQQLANGTIDCKTVKVEQQPVVSNIHNFSHEKLTNTVATYNTASNPQSKVVMLHSMANKKIPLDKKLVQQMTTDKAVDEKALDKPLQAQPTKQALDTNKATKVIHEKKSVQKQLLQQQPINAQHTNSYIHNQVNSLEQTVSKIEELENQFANMTDNLLQDNSELTNDEQNSTNLEIPTEQTPIQPKQENNTDKEQSEQPAQKKTLLTTPTSKQQGRQDNTVKKNDIDNVEFATIGTSTIDEPTKEVALVEQLIESAYKPINNKKKADKPQTQLLEQSNNQVKQITQAQANRVTKDNLQRCLGQWVYPQQLTDNNAQNTAKIDNNSNNYQEQNSPINAEEQSKNHLVKNLGYIRARADYGYYDNNNNAQLSGNVVIEQGNQVINADKVLLDLLNKTAKAEGGANGMVTVQQGGQVIKADTITLDLTTKQAQADGQVLLASPMANNSAQQANNDDLSNLGIVGIADKVNYQSDKKLAEVSDFAFASIPMQAHGYAQSMKKHDDNNYSLQKVTFSTCMPTIVNKKKGQLGAKTRVKRDWQIDADSIDVNSNTGRAKAYNATLKVKDFAIIRLPYFDFPIDQRRSSGLLLPNASLSTTAGLELAFPYYLNLAPNYDATITTSVFPDRNPMLAGEFRYLTKNYGKGQVNGTFLYKDRLYHNNNRSSLFYQHDWQSKRHPKLTMHGHINHLSDPKYQDDFDYLGSDTITNELNLPQQLRINFADDRVDTQLQVETYQRLEAVDSDGKLVQDKDRPYDKLPQLNVKFRIPEAGEIVPHLKLEGEHDSAYFKKSIKDNSAVEKSGFRMYNALKASYPIHRSWGSITPSASIQQLFSIYDKDARVANQITKEDNLQSVIIPQVTLDAQTHFIKKETPFFLSKQLGGYQLLSPRVKYSYAPYKKQNSIPNFNTRIASKSYNQLFADSWFLGKDRVQDLHSITPAINYRYIDKNGLTRIDASVAEQYYLHKGQVSLDDTSSTSEQSNRLFSEKSSGIVASISTQPSDKLWLDIDGATNNDRKLSYLTSQIRYQPKDNSQFSIGVVKRNKDDNTNQLAMSAVTASAIFPVNDNWKVISQTQYDYDNNKFLDSLFGVDYENCCLGVSVYGRQYYNNLKLDKDKNRAIMAELRLKGVSGAGRLKKLLADKIVGIKNVLKD